MAQLRPNRQADPALDRLLDALVSGRSAMTRELRLIPPQARRQMFVRRELLHSLEAYVAALTSRHLPVPPRLRDELSLQRALVPRARLIRRGSRKA
ncbi:MAG: hypothetical protein QOF18_2457 [Frankiaceae bacterium]|nr:hypothetical protein [Frankiaceae bacterium]